MNAQSALLQTILICEGVEDPPGETPEEQEAAYYAAWQELINNGLAWTLQGWFGRTAMHFIEQGHCSKVEDHNPPA
jgi:hypothetical protein